MASGGAPPEPGRERAAPETLAPITFGTLVLSLSSSALVELGIAPAPGEPAPSAPNLPAAQQTIEILEMLRHKTHGNLTPDEERLLESVLHDLRLRFVESKR